MQPDPRKSGHNPKILVVDDEQTTLRTLKRNLSAYGYEIFTATNGKEALAQLETILPDLMLLDLMMPGMDGLEVCRRTREWNQLPIIVLSARGEERQKVEALELGADDYLTKPFGMDELVARIRVALRRISQATPESEPVYTQDGLEINFAQRRVSLNGQEINLTSQQYALLQYLAHNPRRILPHRTILREVWGTEYETETQYLHVFVSQLRQKIEPDSSRPRFIKTERGYGYRFGN
jgi:two-component system KDP operon response regulator KdpE